MPRRLAKRRWRKVRLGWWVSLDHSGFAALLSFANAKIEEVNWEATLWDSLGVEKLVAVATDEGSTLMFAADVYPATEVNPQITPYIPKIGGQQATLDHTLKLQAKVRLILTRMAGTVDLVYRERNGQAGTDWVERTKRRGMGVRDSDLPTLSWDCTHFEERQAILEMIKQEFNVDVARSATIVPGSGFICFEDAGEDASNTVAWLLMCLLEAVFEEERPVLRKCLFCEAFFIHRSLRQKKFCSDQCRFNFHNKGLHKEDGRG